MALQTLDRAVAALQALGAAGPMGLRLIHLQQSLGLTKPTTHRLMQALVDHGLARHVDETRRYHLGPSLRLMSNLAPSEGPDLLKACTPAIQRLAEASGDTVFLGARDGLYTVCMSRATGDYPIRAITVEVGSRRPLGIGAGGLALLASREEIMAIVRAELVEVGSFEGAVAPDLGDHECRHPGRLEPPRELDEVLPAPLGPGAHGDVATVGVESDRDSIWVLRAQLLDELRVLDRRGTDHDALHTCRQQVARGLDRPQDRKSTRLNSSHRT